MSNYYLGIDVSKGYADFILLADDKTPVDDGFQLDDTYNGHQKLFSYLQTVLQRYPNATIYAAVESTGGYENNWYNSLFFQKDILPLQVARLNPFRVKANSQAAAKRNKTDPISAKDVAEYLIAHPEKIIYNQEEPYSTLRRQWSYISISLKQQSQLSNHLESLLYASMPELLNFCRNGIPAWLLKVLNKYPTYQALHDAGVKKLSKLAYLSTSKAQLLINRIENTIGQSDEISGQIIQSITEQLLALDLRINTQKKLLKNNYTQAKDEVELLCSFNGIGIYSAVGLLLNIVSIHRFPTVKHLASYFGLHPLQKQSGDGKKVDRMSKQGRSEPRAILYMVAWSAVQHNPIIKDLYARCLQKGMAKNAALGVCMHKILRIVYGMLKNNAAFDPKVDRKHQEKQQNQTENQQPKIHKKRRLQDFDKNAPTSRRQRKKRKEQALSQDENIAKCGIKEFAPSS